MSGNIIDHIVRAHNARFLEITPEYMVLEKTGHKSEIVRLLDELEPFGVLQYVRSGRVAITKQVKELNAYLIEMDQASRTKNEEAEVYSIS